MEVIDLGAKVPAKLKHSHLSKISKKRSLSPSSGSSSRNLSPDVISKIESRKSELIDVIQLILQSKELKHSYEWYYTTTERLCRFKPIEQSFLSKAIFDALEDYYVNEVGPKLKGVFTENINGTTVEIAEARARGFLDVYEDYDRKTRLLGKVFLYLDRSYLKQHPVKKVIMEFGLKMLVDDICTNFAITVKKDENIEGETGEDIDMDIDIDKEPVTSITALSTMLQIPTTLLHSVRVSKFESPLIPITTSFISGLVKLNNSFDSPFPLNRTFIDRSITDHSIISKQTLKNSPSTYFSSFQSYLTLELSFMISCNESKKTRDTFQSKFTWCWIFKNLNSVLKLIFPTISKENLLSLFKLCQGAELEYKIDACGIFKYEWNENLFKEVSNTLWEAESKGKQLIPLISMLSKKFHHEKEKEDFGKGNNDPSLVLLNENLEFELRNAIAKAINNSVYNTKIITQLCNICDQYLKKSRQQHQSTGDDEEFQNSVITIFKLLSNKSTFIVNYKRELSRRLLFQKYNNIELERLLAEKLCSIIGDGFELVEMIDEFQTDNKPYFNDIEMERCFRPIILTKKTWPEFPSYTKLDIITLPKELQNFINDFQRKFLKLDKNNEKMVLDWNYFNYHQITITSNFSKGKKDLVVNLLQASIIFLFNNAEEDIKLTTEEVSLKLTIELDIARLGLKSLSDKYKILIEREGIFTFNNEFNDKSSKIKIPYKGTTSTKPINGKSLDEKQIERFRTSEIRALIVRTLKLEKELDYTKVLTVSAKKLESTGPINIADIKTNIEYLIESEFISRDKDKLKYIP